MFDGQEPVGTSGHKAESLAVRSGSLTHGAIACFDLLTLLSGVATEQPPRSVKHHGTAFSESSAHEMHLDIKVSQDDSSTSQVLLL
jgi:hypothetical protein